MAYVSSPPRHANSSKKYQASPPHTSPLKRSSLTFTPDASLAVFAPGSRHKAASLVEALDCFEEGVPRANEIIRGIKADLAGAVDTCIEAAGLEPDPVWQKKLLRVRLSLCACR